MDVKQIQIRDIENRWESLPLALQAIARWAGVELHFRSLNAALGLSFIVSCPRDEDVSLAWWMTYGRDAFLVETGKLFGLTISRIEYDAPPRGSAEAFDHFNSTLKPQIQQHLADNKPVLAWQGWPDYHSQLWGVLTEEGEGELGFSGTVMWTHGERFALKTPPARLYVVEDASPKQPDQDELLKFAIRNARKVVKNEIPEEYGVVTGLPAYSKWLAWLSEDTQKHANGDGGPNAHYQMAQFVTHNRESACRFLDYYKDGLHDDVQPYLEAVLADCNGVINTLATSRDLKAVEVLYKTEDGRKALAAGVVAAHDFLKAQSTTLDHVAERLGL